MILEGEHDGHDVSNTSPEEIRALIEAYKAIRPREVMLYSIDRTTPAEKLRKVPRERLEEIAEAVRAEGIEVQVN